MSDPRCSHVWSVTGANPIGMVTCALCNERVDLGIALEDICLRIQVLEALIHDGSQERLAELAVRLNLRDRGR